MRVHWAAIVLLAARHQLLVLPAVFAIRLDCQLWSVSVLLAISVRLVPLLSTTRLVHVDTIVDPWV
jgi:hypothetical protein